jgi:hypothetical protein
MSLDPKSRQRMSQRIYNKRTVEAKLSLCFVNKYATKTNVSGGMASYILQLDTRRECSASSIARSTPREGDAGTQEKGGLAYLATARQRTPIPRLSCPQPNNYTD